MSVYVNGKLCQKVGDLVTAVGERNVLIRQGASNSATIAITPESNYCLCDVHLPGTARAAGYEYVGTSVLGYFVKPGESYSNSCDKCGMLLPVGEADRHRQEKHPGDGSMAYHGPFFEPVGANG